MNTNEFNNEFLFNTKRLNIRRLNLRDLEPFHEMQSDIDVMRYALGKALNYEENKADLERIIKAYEHPDNEFWIWAIEDLKQKFLGTLALILDREKNWEIGFRLLKSQWGKGYASEAVEGLVILCTSIELIDNLVAHVDLRNPGSSNVLNKNGFVNLGIQYNHDEECEEYFYSINTQS